MTAQREVSVLIVKPFAMPSNSAHDGCTERGTDTGVVIEQKENSIVVQYPDAIVKMTLGNVIKTFNRPIFEKDDEVWNTFAQYASLKNDLEKQQKKRNSLSKELEALENGKLPG